MSTCEDNAFAPSNCAIKFSFFISLLFFNYTINLMN
jgi:hypothetical protein